MANVANMMPADKQLLIVMALAAIFERGTQLPNHELVPVVGENISMPDTLKVISEAASASSAVYIVSAC